MLIVAEPAAEPAAEAAAEVVAGEIVPPGDDRGSVGAAAAAPAPAPGATAAFGVATEVSGGTPAARAPRARTESSGPRSAMGEAANFDRPSVSVTGCPFGDALDAAPLDAAPRDARAAEDCAEVPEVCRPDSATGTAIAAARINTAAAEPTSTCGRLRAWIGVGTSAPPASVPAGALRLSRNTAAIDAARASGSGAGTGVRTRSRTDSRAAKRARQLRASGQMPTHLGPAVLGTGADLGGVGALLAVEIRGKLLVGRVPVGRVPVGHWVRSSCCGCGVIGPGRSEPTCSDVGRCRAVPGRVPGRSVEPAPLRAATWPPAQFGPGRCASARSPPARPGSGRSRRRGDRRRL